MGHVRSTRGFAPGAVRLSVLALIVALGTAGCAQIAPSAKTIPTPTPSVGSATPSVTPTPAATPTPKTLYEQLDAKTKKQFKGCLKTTVRPGSSGRCATLVLKKLKKYGFYPSSSTKYVSTAGANALLNYQRSRGLDDTATTTQETWAALALNTPAVPKVLPAKCTNGTYKIIICVDQAQRRLFWIKNGKVVKTFKVRVGGWAYLKKKDAEKGEWRVFATANGTWKVFNKQVDPYSENYGYGAMPYSTMFHSDMYVHYSPGFHAVGYAQSSHGCVNIGQLSQAVWIFKHTPIGTPVYIYSLKAPKVTTSAPSASTSPSATPTATASR